MDIDSRPNVGSTSLQSGTINSISKGVTGPSVEIYPIETCALPRVSERVWLLEAQMNSLVLASQGVQLSVLGSLEVQKQAHIFRAMSSKPPHGPQLAAVEGEDNNRYSSCNLLTVTGIGDIYGIWHPRSSKMFLCPLPPNFGQKCPLKSA